MKVYVIRKTHNEDISLLSVPVMRNPVSIMVHVIHRLTTQNIPVCAARQDLLVTTVKQVFLI